ncbi:MAG: tRNA (adenosine(37)-N6)-threonylcarbamoyltransferase complex transferase subunit TsaD [Rhodothermales bacterium]
MPAEPLILGIESSCDDTAAAVARGPALLSSVISSQWIHTQYGGVVPELASRAHQRLIVPIVETALRDAGVTQTDLDAVAVTYGPGLAGSLLVGLSFAKALALALDIPLIGVNHLEGHIYSARIEAPHPPFPYLCLIVSGGHTQLVVVEDGFTHRLLGKTRDDAAGEAFDKVAKLLGLGYPGGPEIDRRAREGDPRFHAFPRPRLGPYEFSFSGLKTSVLYFLNAFAPEERRLFLEEHMADLCASFQQAIIDVLIAALRDAVAETGIRHAAIVGGVSANSALRAAAAEAAAGDGFSLYIPPLAYCMDNAAMIAITGYYKHRAGRHSPLTLTAAPDMAV